MDISIPKKFDKAWLDELYTRYNHPSWIHPDPLEFLYLYDTARDKEIVGLIASSLAYGRVTQILKSVEKVLSVMGASPCDHICSASEKDWEHAFKDFKHRFTTGKEIVCLLMGIKNVVLEFGSLKECFLYSLKKSSGNYLDAISVFVGKVLAFNNGVHNTLIPNPSKGSACKRLHLFMRWMVRKDKVDPGPWEEIPAEKLIIPLDTHIFRICTQLGMTSRKSADIRCAIEITEAFKEIEPQDPVKYDFALSRLGIRSSLDT